MQIGTMATLLSLELRKPGERSLPDPNFPRLDLKDLAKPVQEIQYEYCGGRTHCRRTSSWRSVKQENQKLRKNPAEKLGISSTTP